MGCFYKITGFHKFLGLNKLFSIEKGVDHVYSSMDRVHGHRAPVYDIVDQSRPIILFGW
jgi:hypothetical protein